MPSKLISTFGFKNLLSVGVGEGNLTLVFSLGSGTHLKAHQGVRFKNSAFSALNDSIDYVAIVKLFSCLTDIFLRTRRRIRFTAEIWVLINQCLLRAKSGPKLATQYRCGDVTARKVLKGMDALIKKQFITA